MMKSAPSKEKKRIKEPNPTKARFVPLRENVDRHPVYRDRLLSWTLIGAVVLGWLAYAITEGPLPVAGLGQFAAAGWGVATFTGAGVGAALGGMIGGIVAILQLPPPPSKE